jgi:nitrogen regulatory protein PII
MAGPQAAPTVRSEAPADATPLALPAGSARIIAAVAPTSEAAMATALANAGVDGLTFTPVHRTVVHRYRGAESEQRVLDHLRLEALAPAEAVDGVRSAIARAAAATGQPVPEIAVEVSTPSEASEEEPSPKLHALADVRSA